MASYNDTGYGTVRLAEAVAKSLRVDHDGNIADASEIDMGVTTQAGVAGEPVTVSLVNKPGTQKATASGAIAKGARVFTAAGGKVSAASPSGSYFRGIAMEAAADGEIFQIMPAMGQTPTA